MLNGVDRADDNVIWSYAAERGLAIVTKDADFLQRSWLLAPPAKLIMLRVGDAGTRAVEALLRRQRNRIAKFLADPEKSLLVLAA